MVRSRCVNLFLSMTTFVGLSTTLMPTSVSWSQETSNFENKHVFHIASSPDYLPTQSVLNKTEFTSIDEIRSRFVSPGTDYATAPLWVWNDLLTETQIRSTLDDLNKQNVNMAFVHPRPGLATPYLSDSWFKLWDVALDEAAKRGMKIWIYDENSYPSGFAGGLVPDAMPESRGSGLDVVMFDSLVDGSGKWQIGTGVVYVIEELKDGSTVNRSAEVLSAQTSDSPAPPKTEDGSRWIVGRIQLAGTSQWHGGKTYVNLMTKGVLDAFIGFTHEAYRKHYANQLGSLIPGAFTDEPQVASAGMFSWTADFPEEFKKRRGYDVIPHIGSLIEPIGNWKKVRYDYYKTVLEVFIERWHKPLAEYCENVGIEYTGHDWEHEWPNAHHCPDNMATAFWRQRPAIDLLMNSFSRGPHSQFGNVRSVRELNSVTRQAGRCRSISENYGAGGYDIQFEDLKRLGDWSYALGVNTTDEHLSYISIRGARKHDHPQTFSYHSPWFEQYSKLEDYWTRLSFLLSRGELSSERFLLIEPTTTTWLYQHNSGAENNGKKDQIGNEFAELLNVLEASQLDYDLGSEDIIERVGSIKNGRFYVGAAQYQTVVLPASVENLEAQTIRLLAEFTRKGGTLLSLCAPLTLVDGLEFNELDETLKADFEQVQKAAQKKTTEELAQSLIQTQPAIVKPEANETNVFHQLRKTQDGIILFICNIDLENSVTGCIEFKEDWSLVEEFDALTGTIRPYSHKLENKTYSFDLPPCNSIALVCSSNAQKAVPKQEISPIRLDPWKLADSLTSITPCDDNVLVLDYMTVKLQNETLENEYFYRANNWFWNKKGYPMSPWDNGVQFKDELISKRFEDESGFELIYYFEKSDDEINDLRFVVESPELFDVYCNGTKVSRIPNAWKFDRSFGVFDISKEAKSGVNEMKLVAAKSTIFCELMPAWIIGSFSLESLEHGFGIVADKGLSFIPYKPEEETLPHASSALEGVSWLSSGVNFSQTNDRAPVLTFTFNDTIKIDSLRIWNYCEANLAKRGVKEFEMSVLDESGNVKVVSWLPHSFTLRLGDSSAQTIKLPQTLSLTSKEKLRFTIKSNWNSISYPLPDDFLGTTEPQNDNAFVGLAEVQFLDENASPIPAKASASSELVFRNHERRAQFVVDSSGQEIKRIGWASQGRPFYAGSVDYCFELDLSKYSLDVPVVFELPDHSLWRGAVVAVLVNNKQVGAIGWHGESVDLTASLHEALRTNCQTALITARVYGTPKNLFGPHHAGQLRGSAWPGSFHGAPAKQPSGSQYDVIEYGLFTY